MQNILAWLQGKKTVIFSLLALTNTFLAASGLYTSEVAAYIQGVLTIVSGGAVAGTKYLGIKK